ncbi:Cof-type HAD-IIB family hydrolase [endosymbiont of Pachyrhynchus infernalis]|uniref:Cof-type HAD-IIB family hydrolase n=1 Tax=endosymbiont of Pachyrhynchus infernalis TaxID=1971488 RepID=UPI000DC70645|nr:Cof-type HAD-IIB family hydrolase [endosymbiont of Pachyrhynchus infernalis]BBA84778.1 HAD hydrolase IIB family protein [endosymbiont of Pachyrhynchus infernalis]
MYKAIISDLDGTLLNSNGLISDYTNNIIKLLNNTNIKLIIATGRHYIDVSNLINKNSISAFYITANGSVIHDYNNNLIYYAKLDSNVLLEIINNIYLNDDEIYTNIFCNDIWITNPESKLNRFYVKKYDINDIIKNNYILNNSCKIHFNSDNINALSNLKEFLNKNWKDYIEVNFSLPFCLEVNPKNVSKGNTLKFLLNKLNIELNNCISFGDGMNDYDMLSITGKSCLMKNSSNDLKNKLCNLEIIDSNDNDGVAKYIEKNILNMIS